MKNKKGSFEGIGMQRKHIEAVRKAGQGGWVPERCRGVKCMVEGCNNLASHKVGEENIWCNFDEGEKDIHGFYENTHNMTSYLCEEHFHLIMTRDVNWSIPDDRFKDRKTN